MNTYIIIPKIYKDLIDMLFVILSVVLLRFASASIDTTCLPSEEADALAEIGRKLGKDWDFDSNPCCGWFTPGNRTYENSVTCNNCEQNGTICHVTSISLRGQSLHGVLPPELVNLRYLKNIDLARNYLSGTIPLEWGSMEQILNIDLSYNNLTFQRSSDSSYLMRGTKEVSCLEDIACVTNSTSLYINCGGRSLGVGDKQYEGDEDPVRPSAIHSSKSRWGFSNTGHFLDDSNRSSYIVEDTSKISTNDPDLYMTARSSALSLAYYGFCMQEGSYSVNLHFAEIVFSNDTKYRGLGRRLFDIYIQGTRVEKDFDISDEAGGVGKEIVKKYTANVNSTLEIRLYWAGKGTINIPFRGAYGPLISAISVYPNNKPKKKQKQYSWSFYYSRTEIRKLNEKDGPSQGNGNGVSGGIVIGIVVGAIFLIVLIVGFLWSRGYLGIRDALLLIHETKSPLPQPLPSQLLRDSMESELDGLEHNTGTFTLRQIKIATNNFDVANKIGEGGFGPVYKGVLPDGTLIAVKQLSAKSRQGNREFLNELGMISALQHPNLVKLHGCCIEGNQLLLAYEYMENNSLARALFGPKEWQLELDWPTRYRICIDIARGLAFLHEESRLKIVHRDIKATNVLLNKNLNAKISDFGLAKLDEEDNTHISTRIAGTFGYMAPEYALRGYLTDKADVYSYGVVLLEIVSGMANIVDRANENHFVLLDQAIALNKSGDLLELVDPRLESHYDHEMMVVIKIALVCTTISPTDRPVMSSVVRMLEERIAPQAFVSEQSVTLTEIDHDNMIKQLEKTNETQIEETSNTYTNFSVSDVDLYPVDRFSDYMQKRDIDANN